MKTNCFLSRPAISLILVWLLVSPTLEAQNKKLKRPTSRVGVASVDTFVRESFDLYDKVYFYDTASEEGRPLDDSDIDVLENALDDLTGLSANAHDVISDLGGAGALKQTRGTLQVNRAK